MNENFDAVRRTLITLLVRKDDEPIFGVDSLTDEQKFFLLTTSSAEVMVHAICSQTGFKVEDALKGLDSIYPDMKKNIIERCKEVN